jgi:recombination protein RecT
MSEQKGLAILKDMVNSAYVKARFAEVMGEKAPAFLASIMNATRTNPSLSDCDPQSVISSAMVAATLDLPIDGSLGFAALVPYRNKGVQVAQFQIMTKGFVQLALRSGQYKTINVGPVYDDEFDGFDIITGEVRIHPVDGGARSKDDESKVVGYVCFFRLINGYECTRYWSMDKIIAHGKRYSKSFDKEYGLWKTDLPAMASKTVLKNTLSKWGILSTTMQMAVKVDQAAIKGIEADKEIDYVDAAEQETVPDRPPEEVIKPAENSTQPADFSLSPEAPEDTKQLWNDLIEWGNVENIPAAAKKEVEAALIRNEQNPIELRKLLNKVKTACGVKA